MRAKAQLTECPYDLLIDPGAVEIYADPLLHKVFYNMLENAIRHGENVSTVHFSSRESGNELILVCEDNGVGVKKAPVPARLWETQRLRIIPDSGDPVHQWHHDQRKWRAG
jgi:K+-sensing histidine kinase KdpD